MSTTGNSSRSPITRASEKPIASAVQPGVSARGKKNTTDRPRSVVGRNDSPARNLEGLPSESGLLAGEHGQLAHEIGDGVGVVGLHACGSGGRARGRARVRSGL